ncbi:hypothetical protein EsDP_00004483 [Epichloe bromicola]|uniref:AB hydrolase-1 domain-containing protein n=1 Tax=Epichloe bromicola TaxID=79588 RepID=A0ABQ0CRV8_9HYPO
MPSPSPITVFFVPGAWHSAQSFAPVAQILREEGFRTELIELPSVGPLKHVGSFDPDVDVIRRRVSEAIANGQRVAIVAHSYGGIPACQALRDFVGRDGDGDGAARDKIVHLYFCTSFIIPENASLIAAFGGNALPWFRVSEDGLEVNPDTPEHIFYNDVPEDKVGQLVRQLKPQSYRVMHSPLTFAAWKHVPCTYLYCSRDNAIPPEIQKMMVEGTAAGYGIRTDEIDAGHSPHLTKPNEVAESIAKAIRSTS